MQEAVPVGIGVLGTAKGAASAEPAGLYRNRSNAANVDEEIVWEVGGPRAVAPGVPPVSVACAGSAGVEVALFRSPAERSIASGDSTGETALESS